jgi:hypothetical protein
VVQSSGGPRRVCGVEGDVNSPSRSTIRSSRAGIPTPVGCDTFGHGAERVHVGSLQQARGGQDSYDGACVTSTEEADDGIFEAQQRTEERDSLGTHKQRFLETLHRHTAVTG